MRPLTRPSRQVLATLAMLAGTVAPTAYVGWMAWRVNRPDYPREVERELGRALGLNVAIKGVAYPRPGEVVYRGIVLRPEESRRGGGSEIGRADVVRLRRGSGELTIEAGGLRLRGDGPRSAMAQVADLLRRAGEAPEGPRVVLTAPDCALVLGDGDGAPRYRLKEVIGVFRPDPGAPTATFSYRVATAGPANRCELTVTRDTRGEAVRTAITFQTMDGPPLPADVLNPFFDSAAWLGPRARVDGTLAMQQVGDAGWEADFSGNLYEIDLGTLVGKRFPDHRLTGLARLAIRSARWAARPGAPAPGWVEVDGELASTGPGTIGAGLVRALRSEMNFRLSGPEALRPELTFGGLAFTFRIDRDGEIRIGGGFGTDYPPGVVLFDARDGAAMVSAPDGAANVLGLVNALVPRRDGSVLVSGGREAQALQSCLPLPPTRVGRSGSRTN